MRSTCARDRPVAQQREHARRGPRAARPGSAPRRRFPAHRLKNVARRPLGSSVPQRQPGEQLEHGSRGLPGTSRGGRRAVGDERAAAARASATSRRCPGRRRGRTPRRRRRARARAPAPARPRRGSRPGSRRASRSRSCCAGPRGADDARSRRGARAARARSRRRPPRRARRSSAPARTRALRCSMRQAVTPLTTTVSAAAGVHAVGHRDEVARVEHHAVGPAADLGQRRDARALGDARVAAGALDDPDEVVAGHERERRLVVVLAAPHLLLGERDAGGLDPDERLARPGRRAARASGPAGISGSPMPGSTISVACICFISSSVIRASNFCLRYSSASMAADDDTGALPGPDPGRGQAGRAAPARRRRARRACR